jgi:hypothetical protein
MVRCCCAALVCLSFAARIIAAPAEVIIIRHAEKPPEGPELNLKGEERAAALVPYFLHTPEVLEHQLPVAIYAQAVRKATASRRAIETVKPLADALKLPVVDRFSREEFQGMVNEILSKPEYEGHTVLICWEHKVIPEIAKAFHAAGAPATWPGDAYDRTWIITFPASAGAKPTCKTLPQKLLFGDSAN